MGEAVAAVEGVAEGVETEAAACCTDSGRGSLGASREGVYDTAADGTATGGAAVGAAAAGLVAIAAVGAAPGGARQVA